jgi:hypothetical protein
MSLQVRASSVLVVVLALSLLCGVSSLIDGHTAIDVDNPANAVVYSDVRGLADGGWSAEEADQEDGESHAPTRDIKAPAVAGIVAPVSTKRSRHIRPDRPPRLTHLS